METKLSLLKIINNAKQTTYSEVREIRKNFNLMLKMRNVFSMADKREADKIKDLLKKLKETHPEVCSKDEFIKSSDSQLQSNSSKYQETTFDRPTNASDNLSINMLSNSVRDHSESHIFLKPATPKKSKKNYVAKATKTSRFSSNNQDSLIQTPVASDSESIELSQEEITRKIHQYRLWALELRDALDKQQMKKNT